MPTKLGRPPKKPISTRISSAINIAQSEIDDILPFEEQEPLVEVITGTEQQPTPKITKDATDDYDFARGNLHNLLMKGNDVLNGIVDLAQESDHPRTYEVAGILLKVLIEGTGELMGLQKDIRAVQKDIVPTSQLPSELPDGQNPQVYEGTTMQMLEIVEELKRRKLEKNKAKEQGN